MTVTSDQFIVGSHAVVTCSSDSGVVDRIEWVSGAGQVVASAVSVQTLDLVLDPVQDTLQRMMFTCIVTRGTKTANQTLPVTVTSEYWSYAPQCSINIITVHVQFPQTLSLQVCFVLGDQWQGQSSL